MRQEPTDVTSAEIRSLRIELAKSDFALLAELLTSLLRWTLTTMLVLNAGGLAALAGSDALRHLVVKSPAWAFGAGACLAMGGALALIIGLAKSGQTAFEKLWNGGFIEQSYEEYMAGDTIHFATLFGAILFGLSLLAFIVGCVLVGLNGVSS